MSHPPIPNSEFSPSWHQYFVKLRDYLTTYVTTTDSRLDELEASQAATDEVLSQEDDDDYPVGCVALLAFASGVTLTAGEKITLSGSELRFPEFYSASSAINYRVGELVNIGTWKLVGPPVTGGYKAPYSFYNFKRIS